MGEVDDSEVYLFVCLLFYFLTHLGRSNAAKAMRRAT